jgi:hypothetical protein
MEPDDIDEPDWNSGGRVHNWKNYVGEATMAIWPTLTHEQRYAIYADYDRMASCEDWD